MRALFLDVELSRTGRLYGLAALGPEGQEEVATTAAEARRLLRTIADWDVDLLVGHNLGAHDRPWLAREDPRHPALSLPWVDTLVLSPLAFPERPYHRLVKEERLVRESQPAPLADCRAARTLLEDEIEAFGRMDPALRSWIRAALADPAVAVSGPGWAEVIGGPAPSLEAAWGGLRELLDGRVCGQALARLRVPAEEALAFAYLSAWLLVPPGSTLPAWTRVRFPATRRYLELLRGPGCGGCAWCDTQTPEAWLGRMFGYPAFRDTPAAPDGTSLQRAIVAAGMEGRPLYAVLPTGTGKSLCFQIPAAARHRRRGDLTVVISPLQSLMKDQVDQLRKRDPHCTTVNGSLTLPERARALDEVRSGATSLVYLSPEQLRNGAVRRVLAVRNIGAWVIDEAHCLTEWGHDFRPDYLYVPRFARELAEEHGQAPPPFQCFTGTSQLAVTEAIRTLVREELGQELEVFDGGTERSNLALRVERCAAPDKLTRTLELLEEHLDRGKGGAGIVFCATRRGADAIAERLQRHGWEAASYHAGLDPQLRRDVQDRFLGRELQVIAATSAFGMGVDKDDVRLVVHQEVPGSLESYLQQAGRAGRDGAPATCVLLHEPRDLDTPFRLAQTTNLSLADLRALWRGLRLVPARREGATHTRVVTTGELARLEPVSALFDPKDPVTDTRLTAALAWLERAKLFHRDENRTTVFSGRPRFPTLELAKKRLAELGLPPAKATLRERLLARLYDADPDEGLTADALADLDPGETDPLRAGDRLLGTLQEMVQEGLVDGGVQLSAFLAWGVANPARSATPRSSRRRAPCWSCSRSSPPWPGWGSPWSPRRWGWRRGCPRRGGR